MPMLDLLITHATLPDGRQNMSIAVQGGRLGGCFVIGAISYSNAQAMGCTESARTDRRLHTTPTGHTQKGPHEGTPCRPLIGWQC